MIGSGIFISPKGILENTGSVGMSIVIWVLCGLISMCGALCYAELGTMIPKSGAEFNYFLETYGGMIAFMYLWVANFILKPASAIIILACAEYIVQPFYEGTSCGAPDITIKLIAICIAGESQIWFKIFNYNIPAKLKKFQQTVSCCMQSGDLL
ncbi:cystine/glutamate transporter-like [Amphiura filiformis]|uniref:cystine/glutamate transporter-like n=1 Tax=Amphiura filiformis TaxID=82378 RepID=UPI003B20DA8D